MGIGMLYRARVRVNYILYKICIFLINASLLRMLKNMGDILPLGLVGCILGTSDEELPRRPANQTRQDRQSYLTDPPFVTDHFSLTDLEPVRP